MSNDSETEYNIEFLAAKTPTAAKQKPKGKANSQRDARMRSAGRKR